MLFWRVHRRRGSRSCRTGCSRRRCPRLDAHGCRRSGAHRRRLCHRLARAIRDEVVVGPDGEGLRLRLAGDRSGVRGPTSSRGRPGRLRRGRRDALRRRGGSRRLRLLGRAGLARGGYDLAFGRGLNCHRRRIRLNRRCLGVGRCLSRLDSRRRSNGLLRQLRYGRGLGRRGRIRRHRRRFEARRQKQQWVDVALRVRGHAQPEVDERFGAGSSDHRALRDRRPTLDGDRAEVEQRGGISERRLDRDRPAPAGNRPRERHRPVGRRSHGCPLGDADVDPPVLTARVRMRRIEGEGTQDRPVGRPRPGAG